MSPTRLPSQVAPEPIAIIGIGLRFPGGVSNPSDLWNLLQNPPDDLSIKVPRDRFNTDGFYHQDPRHHGTGNCTTSYFLHENIRLFDASFFQITPREAESIDPQQRLLLEVVYEAIEDAGVTLQATRGSDTAVFVGQMSNDYWDHLLRDTAVVPQYMGTGTARSITANRISYFFDWKGPSISLDTACSSSMVAVHQAVQALRSGSSHMAVAAGCHLILGPESYIIEAKINMLSPTGTCKMWDAGADGYARGEGFAALVLKTLSNARNDGDYIVSVIRETGVNQDGKTSGITMPSATAQSALIQSTYQRAGLDIANPRHMPQYFEAHGTGTPAGDPIEAEAIHKAFFNAGEDCHSDRANATTDPLYVGSIKTVLGHLEGTAGIAGIIKATLAMRHRAIAPNLLFSSLNPKIAPFYNGLAVPTSLQPWPKTASLDGDVLRCSVNSFGFGGTNAHAILESYENKTVTSLTEVITPFTLSASCQTSLVALIERYIAYLKANPDVSLSELTFTVQSKRSALPYRIAYSAKTAAELLSQLITGVSQSNSGNRIGTFFQSKVSRPKSLLGVFTGQGAQWPGMGRELLSQSTVFLNSIIEMEDVLALIPDAPEWSLRAEFQKTLDSRLDEAQISQPLSTALQVGLVDLLRESGVTFTAVIGHSSGEIGAAYAAGLINRADAIKIAYYRGKYSTIALSGGGMMAVGLSMEAARIFCSLPVLEGRVWAAASNGPQSSTLSGDLDSLKYASVLLDEAKTFNRMLRVDKAYHSQAMQVCCEPFRMALASCNIEVQNGNGCQWSSSVHEGHFGSELSTELSCDYWVESLINPVLFSQALTHSCRAAISFDAAIEVGPHPVLKGPSTNTYKAVIGTDLQYQGILERGRDDTLALSDCLGFFWRQLGEDHFEQYRHACDRTKETAPATLAPNDLPRYPWNHQTEFWSESRKSLYFRARSSTHELLGVRCDDETLMEMRWRNILKLNELPWLQGHIVQGQVVVPAVFYCIMALEAALEFTHTRKVSIVELRDMNLHRAIILAEDSGTEVLFSLHSVKSTTTEIHAEFNLHSCTPPHQTFGKVCSGRIFIVFEDDNEARHPFMSTTLRSGGLQQVDPQRFYTCMSNIGLHWEAPFLFDLASRAFERSNLLASGSKTTHRGSKLVLHPALLDIAFQAALVAYASPGDGKLWNPTLPTVIKLCTFDMIALQNSNFEDALVSFDSLITDHQLPCYSSAAKFTCDIEGQILSNSRTFLRVEGLTFTSLSATQEANDREMFAQEIWLPLPLSMPSEKGIEASGENVLISEWIERISLFYMRKAYNISSPGADGDIDPQQRASGLKCYCSTASRRMQQLLGTSWMNDTIDDIETILLANPKNLDLQTSKDVGENLPLLMKGEISALELLRDKSPLLSATAEIPVLSFLDRHLTEVIQRISHRYPRMKVLEIGGNGSSLSVVLSALEGSFSRYDFTTVPDFGCQQLTAALFDLNKEKFGLDSNRLSYQFFDMEKAAQDQGFIEGDYSLVILSNLVNSSKCTASNIASIRRLLRPGGFLVALATTSELPRLSLARNGIPVWWVYPQSGKTKACGSAVHPQAWDKLLRAHGFTGISLTVHDAPDSEKRTRSLLVSQAEDSYTALLKDPLANTTMVVGNLLIIGGLKSRSSTLAQFISKSMMGKAQRILHYAKLEDVALGVPSGATAICLSDLDGPILSSPSADCISGLKALFEQARNVLWLTSGRRSDNPYANMMVGLGRCVASESPLLRLQFLDLMDEMKKSQHCVLTTLLQLILTETLEKQENTLWSTEPELLFQDGQLWIPRVKASKPRNDRLNCLTRTIECAVLQKRDIVRMYNSGSLATLQIVHSRPGFLPHQVLVTHSWSLPIAILGGLRGYLCLGRDSMSGAQLTILSPWNQSAVQKSLCSVIECCVAPGNEPIWLASVLAALISIDALGRTANEETLLLHQPGEILARVATHLASAAEKQLCVSSISDVPAYVQGKHKIVQVDSFMSARGLATAIARPVGAFLHLPALGSQVHTRADRTRALLPPSCQIVDQMTSFLTDFSCDTCNTTLNNKALSEAVSVCMDSSIDLSSQSVPSAMDIGSLPGRLLTFESLLLLDWTRSPTISTLAAPLNPSLYFSADKTYLCVGLVSDLGCSLVQWMINAGARHIVLTSRSPQIDESWLENLRFQGVDIMVTSMDVSNEASVREVCRVISTRMPPIAGVANGAMVLGDCMFRDLEAENLERVARPKVTGSVILDKVFETQNLDFFILFSSIACVVGNMGQSSYSAANMFEVALATQRKLRGLRASVIDLGMVIGVGYVSRAGESVQAIEDNMIRQNGIPLSESDVHQIFLEAILLGDSAPDSPVELITGIRSVSASDTQVPLWHENPRFSHLSRLDALTQPKLSNVVSKVPLKVQLEAAVNLTKSQELISIALEAKLKAMLKITERQIPHTSPLVDIGVDSLTAVEIRSWFVKEVALDVPVLQILNGASIDDLSLDVVKRLGD